MRSVTSRSPEVHVSEVIADAVQLDTFHKEEVFPQRPSILPSSCGHRAEVSNDCVSDAIVAEVHLLPFFEFIAQIFGKRGANFDDKALLKESEVVSYCRFV